MKRNQMDEFILIFRHEDGLKVALPEQIQIWMKQTRDWMGGLPPRTNYQGELAYPLQKPELSIRIILLQMDPLVKLRKQSADTLS
jgi:hypothetical protein